MLHFFEAYVYGEVFVAFSAIEFLEISSLVFAYAVFFKVAWPAVLAVAYVDFLDNSVSLGFFLFGLKIQLR